MLSPGDRLNAPRLALALGGGAARGLAHIGVLEVLEREGIHPSLIAASSMGGVVGALAATGLAARQIGEIARGFRFPWWFVPGGFLRWETVFGPATGELAGVDFEDLGTELMLTAVDLEVCEQVILKTGAVLPAVRATCAIPGVLPPERIDGRVLADGGLMNLLPVDVAWLGDPDVVMAVSVKATRSKRMPELDWPVTSWLTAMGRYVPNPATAKVSFELLVRGAEIALGRATALSVAMTSPEVLVEVDLGDFGLRDFDRVDEAVHAGRSAMERALPDLEHALQRAPDGPATPTDSSWRSCVDPVCAMVLSPRRARASASHEGTTFHFCSENCRDAFLRDPKRYYARPAQRA